jgi:tetratricopeptide (TPR) repeat protein
MVEKITRKDIKEPDEFIKKSSLVVEFIAKNRKFLLWTGGAVIVLVIAFFAYHEYLDSLENKASFDMALIERKLTDSKDLLTPDIEKDLRDLMKKYNGTYTALNAKLKLSDLYFKSQKYELAFELYKETYEGESLSILKAVSMTNMAYIREIGSDYKGALEYFSKLLDLNIPVFEIQGYFGMSRCFEKLHEIEKAKEMYNKIIQKYPNSEHAKQARQYLTMLEGN